MNLPVAFIQQTTQLLGDTEYHKLIKSLKKEVPTSFRLNRNKLQKYINLDTSNLIDQQIPWSYDGYYTNERLTFTFDPLFQAGGYYVQEASSMFLEQVLKQYITKPVCMLDLCAAPGGKSTHALPTLPNGSLLISNEVIRSRSFILAENLIKWGDPNCIVTNNDPSDFTQLENIFDVILTDVPCSGEGMFRKDPNAINEWSIENVNICQQRQRRIIKDIWPSLKPGGILIYSTCTFNTKENEENIKWITEEFNANSLPVDIPSKWNITSNLMNNDFPVYRFFPHKTKGEGFFIAILQKPGHFLEDTTYLAQKTKKTKNKSMIPPIPKESKNWIENSEEYSFELKNESIFGIPKIHLPIYTYLSNLKIIHSGIKIGEIKGKDIIPSHSLSMNQHINLKAFNQLEISYSQALSFLRKEALVLSSEVSKGYLLLTYKNLPLGFVKNIGNRANNLYPNEWRIRSSYTPEQTKCLENILSID